MRILLPTLQHIESDFYGRVGRLLTERGHEVCHLTYSRRAAMNLRRDGAEAYCLPDLVGELDPSADPDGEAARIVGAYPISDLAAVYAIDPPCRDAADGARCAERVVGHFRAVEALFDRWRPQLVFSEVGSESIREVSRLVAGARGATTVFPLYTIFDRPLRLCANTIDAPIVSPDELRALTPDEETELDDFTARYRERGRPIREYRTAPVTAARARLILRHLAVRALWDRDNDYLEPGAWLTRDIGHRRRAREANRLYAPVPDGPFLYFPLQVVEDYKILKLRPDCVDQEAIVRRVASALPDEHELVIKQHPMRIGVDDPGLLGRLASVPRVRLVDPRTSSLDLIERSGGVATVSSTVGFEALLLGRPVLTIGRPFYAGFGVTVDADGPGRIPAVIGQLAAPDPQRTRRLLHASMRRCVPGAPVLVDSSDENALRVADGLEGWLDAQLPAARMSESGLSERARS